MDKQYKSLIGILNLYITISVLIAPILQPYVLAGKSISLLLMLSNSILLLIYKFPYIISTNRNEIKFLFFLLYALSIPVIVGTILNYNIEIGSSYRGILLFSFCLFLYPEFVDYERLKNIYRVFVYSAIIVFFAQELSFNLLGFRFSALIPFFQISYEEGTEEFMLYQMTQSRSSSFFLEPAHCATYIFPYFAISLYEAKKKGKILSKENLFLLFFFILFKSGMGIVCSGFMFLLYLKNNISRKGKLLIIMYLILLLFIILFANTLYLFFEENYLSRSKELSYITENSSGMIRITRGFRVFGDMSLLGQLFGLSNGAIGDAVKHSSIAYLFGDNSYVNNVQKLLIGYGVIGTSLFIVYAMQCYKLGTTLTKLVIFSFFLISLMSNNLFDSVMLLYFCVAICKHDDYQNNYY